MGLARIIASSTAIVLREDGQPDKPIIDFDYDDATNRVTVTFKDVAGNVLLSMTETVGTPTFGGDLVSYFQGIVDALPSTSALLARIDGYHGRKGSATWTPANNPSDGDEVEIGDDTYVFTEAITPENQTTAYGGLCGVGDLYLTGNAPGEGCAWEGHPNAIAEVTAGNPPGPITWSFTDPDPGHIYVPLGATLALTLANLVAYINDPILVTENILAAATPTVLTVKTATAPGGTWTEGELPICSGTEALDIWAVVDAGVDPPAAPVIPSTSDDITVVDDDDNFADADSLSLTDVLKYIAEEALGGGGGGGDGDWSAPGFNTQEFVFTCANIPPTGTTMIAAWFGETIPEGDPDGVIMITTSPVSMFVPCGSDGHISMLGLHFVGEGGDPDEMMAIVGTPFDLPTTASETEVEVAVDFEDLAPPD